MTSQRKSPSKAKSRGRAERNIDWIEANIRVPEGKLVGKPVTLSDEQREWLTDLYGSSTRTLILSMARKQGKTAISAMLLLLHLCGPEARANSQLFSAAQSRDQAAILFALAAKMVRLSASLSEYVIVRDTAKQLFCPELGTLYRALSAEASTAYGLSPAFVVHDELGQVRGPRSELFEALETAAGAQEEPLSIIISTQAPTDSDLLSLLIDDALSGSDPNIKVRLYTADTDLDPFGDEAIRQANPHFGAFMNQVEVRRQAEEARRMPSREAAYRNLVLNQRVEAGSPFVSRQIWLANGEPPAPEWGKTPVYAGLDLSEVQDLTSLVLVSANFDVLPSFWLPSEGLFEKARVDRVPYDQWEREGHLLTTPGRSIEYEYIAEFLVGIFDRYNVKKVGFDRWNMRHLRPWLIKAGFTESAIEERFTDFGQGYQSMSPALRELESALLSGKLKHGNHPVLTMCAANAVVKSDEAGNRKLDKKRSAGRIDGMVALTMALGVMPAEASSVSIYESRGLLVI